MKNITIIIIKKDASLETITVKEFKEEDLYKKCGFSKPNNFIKQTEWKVKLDKNYIISLYAKLEGKSNMENKYDFPPPVDTKLFFGSCALVAYIAHSTNDTRELISLSVELWNKIYEKLFGGFEDIVKDEDDMDEDDDEMINIPSNKKTRQGYLKDGFVVDGNDGDGEEEDEESAYYSDQYSDEQDEYGGFKNNEFSTKEEDIKILTDIGSELSEEEYDYDNDDDDEK